jgi:hypothetical protein
MWSPSRSPAGSPGKGDAQRWLPKQLEANDDLTLQEPREAFEEEYGETVSTPTVGRTIAGLPDGGWPIKKSKIAQERDEEARGLWRWLASHFDARRLVFVDESGSNISMTRLREPGLRKERGPTARLPVTAARTLLSSPRSLSKEPSGNR